MSQIQIRLYYDYSNQRIRVDESPAGIKTTVIIDFNTHKTYIITNGQCLTTTIEAPFNPTCIPGNALYSGILQLGGPDGIIAKSYHFSTADSTIQTDYIISENCIPVLEVSKVSLTNPTTETTFVTLTYGNTTIGIQDPSVFDIPAICSQHASMKLPVSEKALISYVYCNG
ncbi:uncharacterized protein TRIADDRAFT_53031 [Trichoplax adhaerens]|uniref:Uncharacterized protein n=1 Tax=Trichoplax adhaerens TaxID=10228 RepID=B3RN42_TRIAD|nr:hypothetical protein TRIADDRAFT_53031 [Trichoplax adhaerens]EDV27387.1 hypothetical protein TRIADDRAFT_53031 [Trichoplax adhaerens]|eukprot:XP_002109221.1 hypothetical protein TRIADDRAFT_53031 [Trichoplax adhaerens]